jgi:hypothetical protein
LLGGWCGAAFLVFMAHAYATDSYESLPSAAVVYALGFAAMFPLHRGTRGPLVMSLAFLACWGIFVTGIVFLATVVEAMPLISLAAALPLAALVVRRFPVDESDAAFARHQRWVIPVVLVVAVPFLSLRIRDYRRSDPAPYERGVQRLGYAVAATFPKIPRQPPLYGAGPASELDWAGFQSATVVTADVREDVLRACGRYVPNDDDQAICAQRHLISRLGEVRQRRNAHRVAAAWWAFALGIAALFAWRGRRRPPEVHAPPTE